MSKDLTTAIALIERIVDACPRRVAGSPSERRAQQILSDAFEQAGATTCWHHFHSSTHLYAVFVVHFGLALVASFLTLAHPAIAFSLHLLVAISYLGDSTRSFFLLRRLLPWRRSQNLLATLSATAPMRRRVVVIAHADAAFTGRVFDPQVVRRGTQLPGPLRHSMLLVTLACLGLAVVDGWILGFGASWWLVLLLIGLSVPPALAWAVNLEVVWRDEVVPGANDNLTGCVTAVYLAQALADKPDDIELVLVCSGAEEAGTCGANALAADRGLGSWQAEDTVVLAIDALTNGDLRAIIDGEIFVQPPAATLVQALDAAAHELGYPPVRPFRIPSGASDAMPFLAAGFPAAALIAVDASIGAPRHYHLPSDTPANLDAEGLDRAMKLVEAWVRRVMAA